MTNISLLSKRNSNNQFVDNSLADLQDIEQFFSNWIKYITEKNIDKVLDLYCEQAILHPTFSTIMHTNNQERSTYFLNLFSFDNLSVSVESNHIRAYNNFAVNSGFYTFRYTLDNLPKEFKARFSFVYTKQNNKWLIIEHHSSVLF